LNAVQAPIVRLAARLPPHKAAMVNRRFIRPAILHMQEGEDEIPHVRLPTYLYGRPADGKLVRNTRFYSVVDRS